MKHLRKFIVFAMLGSAMPSLIYAFSFRLSPYEIGDAVYREINFSQAEIGRLSFLNYEIDQHGAILTGFVGQEETIGDESKHQVREMLNTGTRSTYLSAFYLDGGAEGVRRIPGFVSKAQRTNILSTAMNLPSIPYISSVAHPAEQIIEAMDHNGNGSIEVSEISAIRSDGWMEVVYALNGIFIQGNILNVQQLNQYNQTEVRRFFSKTIVATVRTPKTQRNAMDDPKGAGPIVTIVGRKKDGSIIPVPLGNRVDIENFDVVVDDTESGIRSIEVTRGDSVVVGNFLGFELDQKIISGIPVRSLDEIKVIAVDIAGNETEFNFKNSNPRGYYSNLNVQSDPDEMMETKWVERPNGDLEFIVGETGTPKVGEHEIEVDFISEMQSASVNIKDGSGNAKYEVTLHKDLSGENRWKGQFEILEDDLQDNETYYFSVAGKDAEGYEVLSAPIGQNIIPFEERFIDTNVGGEIFAGSASFIIPFNFFGFKCNIVLDEWLPGGAEYGKLTDPVFANNTMEIDLPEISIAGRQIVPDQVDVVGLARGYRPDVLMFQKYRKGLATMFNSLSGGGVAVPTCPFVEPDDPSVEDAGKHSGMIAATANEATAPPDFEQGEDYQGSERKARVVAAGDAGLAALAASGDKVEAGANKIRGMVLGAVPFESGSPEFRLAEQSMVLFQTAAETYSAVLGLMSLIKIGNADPVGAADDLSKSLGYLQEAGFDYLRCQAHQAGDALVNSAGEAFPFGDQLARCAADQLTGCLDAFLPPGPANCDIIDAFASRTNIGKLYNQYESIVSGVEDFNQNLEQLKIVAGEAGDNLTLNPEDVIARLSVNLLGNAEPVGFYVQAAFYLKSVLDTRSGNGTATLEEQLGGELLGKFSEHAASQGREVVREKFIEQSTQILTAATKNLTNLKGVGGAIGNFLPFLSSAAFDAIESAAYGDKAGLDPEAVLRSLDDPTTISVLYPPNGKVLGITTNKEKLFLMGTASDYLPQQVQIFAQADNGPVVSTGLDMKTLHTDGGGATGRATWQMYVPISHGGYNNLHIWAVNAAGHQTDVNMPVYMVGTQFPREGTIARPVTSYRWQARDNGFFGFGAAITAKSVGRITFLKSGAGETPISEVLLPEGGDYIQVTYPDGTTNPDLEVVYDNNGKLTPVEELEEGKWQLPTDSTPFRLRLRSHYRGKTFINVVGNYEATDLKQYQLQYVDGWINTLQAQAGIALDIDTDEKFGYGNTRTAYADDFIKAPYRVLDTNTTYPGLTYRFVTAWDAWTRRLNGRYTIRSVITDGNPDDPYDFNRRYTGDGEGIDVVDPVWTSGEKDRARFSVGTPVNNTTTADGDIIVPDAYIRAEALFPRALIIDPTFVTLFSDDTPLATALPNTAYAKFSPKYEFFPHLEDRHFNGSVNVADPNTYVRLSFKYTQDDLLNFNPFASEPVDAAAEDLRRSIIERNLGIYRERNDGKLILQDTQQPLGSYSIFTQTQDLTGRFVVLPARAPAIVDPSPVAVPFIFSPEGTSSVEGRATSSLKFKVRAPTSNVVQVQVEVFPENDPLNPVALLKDDIVKQVNTPLSYLGDNAQPFQTIFKERLVDYWFESDGFLSVTWDGRRHGGQRLDFGDLENKFVTDGVYHFVITIKDSVGAEQSYRAAVVKGKVPPSITAIGDHFVSTVSWGSRPLNPSSNVSQSVSIGLDPSVDGEILKIMGRAVYPGPEGFGFTGYRIGLVPSGEDIDVKGNTLTWTYLDMPTSPRRYAGPQDDAFSLIQINGGVLAELPLADFEPGRYDLVLGIYGSQLINDAEGNTTVIETLVDTAVVESLEINLQPGIYLGQADPQPFGASTTLTAKVIGGDGTVTFEVWTTQMPFVQVANLQSSYGSPAYVSAEEFLELPGMTNADFDVIVKSGSLPDAQFRINRIINADYLKAEFYSPQDNSDQEGLVRISGTAGAMDPDILNFWQLHYSLDGGEWLFLREQVRQNLTETAGGELAALDMDKLDAQRVDLRLQVFDVPGNLKEAYATFFVPLKMDLKANPQVQVLNESPAVDTTFTTKVDRTVNAATLVILDSAGNTVRTIFVGAVLNKGEQSFDWDGSKNGGGYASPGRYLAVLTAVEQGNPGAPVRVAVEPVFVADAAQAWDPFASLALFSQGDLIPKPYAEFDVSGDGLYDIVKELEFEVSAVGTIQWAENDYVPVTGCGIKTNSQGTCGFNYNAPFSFPIIRRDGARYPYLQKVEDGGCGPCNKSGHEGWPVVQGQNYGYHFSASNDWSWKCLSNEKRCGWQLVAFSWNRSARTLPTRGYASLGDLRISKHRRRAKFFEVEFHPDGFVLDGEGNPVDYNVRGMVDRASNFPYMSQHGTIAGVQYPALGPGGTFSPDPRVTDLFGGAVEERFAGLTESTLENVYTDQGPLPANLRRPSSNIRSAGGRGNNGWGSISRLLGGTATLRLRDLSNYSFEVAATENFTRLMLPTTETAQVETQSFSGSQSNQAYDALKLSLAETDFLATEIGFVYEWVTVQYGSGRAATRYTSQVAVPKPFVRAWRPADNPDTTGLTTKRASFRTLHTGPNTFYYYSPVDQTVPYTAVTHYGNEQTLRCSFGCWSVYTTVSSSITIEGPGVYVYKDGENTGHSGVVNMQAGALYTITMQDDGKAASLSLYSAATAFVGGAGLVMVQENSFSPSLLSGSIGRVEDFKITPPGNVTVYYNAIVEGIAGRCTYDRFFGTRCPTSQGSFEIFDENSRRPVATHNSGSLGAFVYNGSIDLKAGQTYSFKVKPVGSSSFQLFFDKFKFDIERVLPHSIANVPNDISSPYVIPVDFSAQRMQVDGYFTKHRVIPPAAGTDFEDNSIQHSSLAGITTVASTDDQLEVALDLAPDPVELPWNLQKATVRDNYALWSRPLAFNIFENLTNTAGYYEPFERTDNTPHSSTWQVQAPVYPGTKTLHEDYELVAFDAGLGNAAGNGGLVIDTTGKTFVPSEPSFANDGFVVSETYDQFIGDKVRLKLKDPSPEPYVGRGYVRLSGTAAFTGEGYYLLESKEVGGDWRVFWHSNVSVTAGLLGYYENTRGEEKPYLGAVDFRLTIVNGDGGLQRLESSAAVGHVFEAGVDSFAADVYEQVSLFMPAEALTDGNRKHVSIQPLHRHQVPLLSTGDFPVGLIFNFTSVPGLLNRDDFKKDANGRIPNPGVLTIQYSDAQLPEGLDDSYMALYRISDDGSELELVPSYVDTFNKVVNAEITSFSTYELLPDFDPPIFKVEAAPDPTGFGRVSIVIKANKVLLEAPTVKVSLPSPGPLSVTALPLTPLDVPYLNGVFGGFARAVTVAAVTTGDKLENPLNRVVLARANTLAGLPTWAQISSNLDTAKSWNAQMVNIDGVFYKIRRAMLTLEKNAPAPDEYIFSLVVEYVGGPKNGQVVEDAHFLADKDWWASAGTLGYRNGHSEGRTQYVPQDLVVLKTFEAGESTGLPVSAWWGGKRLQLAGVDYTVQQMVMEGNAAIGGQVRARLIDGLGVTLTADNDPGLTLGASGWTVYRNTPDFRVNFDVLQSYGPMFGTATVSVSGRSLANVTGTGKGLFFVDTELAALRLAIDPEVAPLNAQMRFILDANEDLKSAFIETGLTPLGASMTAATLHPSGVGAGRWTHEFSITPAVAAALPTGGAVGVTVTVTSMGGGTQQVYGQFLFDPGFSGFENVFAPSPVTRAVVSITFESTEALRNLPRVELTDPLDRLYVLPVSEVFPDSGQYRAAWTVPQDLHVEDDLPGSTATFVIQGVDEVGNAASAVGSFNIDTIAPDPVTGVSGVLVSATEAQISWFRAENHAGDFLTYRVYVNDVPVLETTALQTDVAGLVYGIENTIEVSSLDNLGNESTRVLAAVWSDLQPPTVQALLTDLNWVIDPSGVTYTAALNKITFTATDDASGVKAIMYALGISGDAPAPLFLTVTGTVLPVPFDVPLDLTYTAFDYTGKQSPLVYERLYVDSKAPHVQASGEGSIWTGEGGLYDTGIDILGPMPTFNISPIPTYVIPDPPTPMPTSTPTQTFTGTQSLTKTPTPSWTFTETRTRTWTPTPDGPTATPSPTRSATAPRSDDYGPVDIFSLPESEVDRRNFYFGVSPTAMNLDEARLLLSDLADSDTGETNLYVRPGFSQIRLDVTDAGVGLAVVDARIDTQVAGVPTLFETLVESAEYYSKAVPAGLAEGRHVLQWKVSDLLGNESLNPNMVNRANSVEFIADSSAPQIRFFSACQGCVGSGYLDDLAASVVPGHPNQLIIPVVVDPWINASGGSIIPSGLGLLEVEINGGGFSVYGHDAFQAAVAGVGSFNVILRATDRVGNQSTRSLLIDKTVIYTFTFTNTPTASFTPTYTPTVTPTATVTSTVTWTPTITNTPCSDCGVATFNQIFGSSSSFNRRDVDLGDFDGDGFIDLVVGNGVPSQFIQINEPAQVYRGDGTGNFTLFFEETSFKTSADVEWVDIDLDGDLDFVLAGGFFNSKVYEYDQTTNSFIFHSDFDNLISNIHLADFTGDGYLDVLADPMNFSGQHQTRLYRYDPLIESFVLHWIGTLPSGNTFVASVGDFDQVNGSDFVVGHTQGSTSTEIHIFKNNGTGQFIDTVHVVGPGNHNVSRVWAEDLNGDSISDVLALVSTSPGGEIRAYLSDGLGGLTQVWTQTIVTNVSIDFGDYDNDGDLDLLEGKNGINQVYANNGSGVFSSVWTSLESEDTRSVAWGDYDSDGDLDQLVSNSAGLNRVYCNTAGGFTLTWSSLTADNSAYLAWADFNRDGGLDQVELLNGSGPVRVYRNESCFFTPTPSITKTFSHSPTLTPTLTISQTPTITNTPCSDCGAVTFNQSFADFNTYPRAAVALADFNGDGFKDVLMGNGNSAPGPSTFAPSQIFVGDGAGGFALFWTEPISAGVSHARWADMDNDGYLDVVLLANFSGTNRIYRYNPVTLTFDPYGSGLGMGNMADILIFDANGDGYNDILAVRFAFTGPTTSNLYTQNPLTGVFSITWQSNVGSYRQAVVEDFDVNPGKDIVFANNSGLEFYSSNGAGSYTYVGNISAAGSAQGVHAADLNSDGHLDLLAPMLVSSQYLTHSFLGDSLGGFTLAWTGTDHSANPTAQDLNGDNNVDLVLPISGGNNKVLLNDGDGTFTPFWSSSDTDNSTKIETGDYDGDGDLDLLVQNSLAPNKVYCFDGASYIETWVDAEPVDEQITWFDASNDGLFDVLAWVTVGGELRLYRNESCFPTPTPSITVTPTVTLTRTRTMTTTLTPTVTVTYTSTPFVCRSIDCTQTWFQVGNAGEQVENGIILTEDTANQSSAMWADHYLDLSTDFDVEFDMYFGTEDELGANGFAFLIHNDPRGIAAIGAGDVSLGYADGALDPALPGIPISPSVALEFDTHQNTNASDPAYDHSSLHFNGNASEMGAVNLTQISATQANVEDGVFHRVRLKWNPINARFEMHFDGQLRIQHTQDFINDVFGGEVCVYWGFTASTGGLSNLQQVVEVACLDATPTFSVTSSRTITSTSTITPTPLPSATDSPLPSRTVSPSPSFTVSPSPSITATASNSPSPTVTITPLVCVYSVGMGQTYTTIAQAMAALSADEAGLGYQPFDCVKEIRIFDGTYTEALTLDPQINPSDFNHLIIGAAPGQSPVVAVSGAIPVALDLGEMNFVRVRGLNIQGAGQAAVSASRSQGLIFENNRIGNLGGSDTVAVSLSGLAGGIVQGNHFEGEATLLLANNRNLLVASNYFDQSNLPGSRPAVLASGGQNLKVVNNLFVGQQQVSLDLRGVEGARLFNNTFARLANPALYVTNFSRNIRWINNLVTNVSTDALVIHSNASVGFEAHHNLYHAIDRYGFVGYSTYDSLSDSQAGGAEAFSVEAEPMLVNVLGSLAEDFKLTATSPAARRGLAMAFEVSTDYFGNPRGPLLDIGFHQYQGFVPTFSPTPDVSATATPTFSVTPTATHSVSSTVTPTFTSTVSSTATATPTFGVVGTLTQTPDGSATISPSLTVSYTSTPTGTATSTASNTPSVTETLTQSPVFTPTATPTMPIVYLVGEGQTYATIQDALMAIVGYNGGANFIKPQIVRIFDGAYAESPAPAEFLKPSAAFPLIVEAAAGAKPALVPADGSTYSMKIRGLEHVTVQGLYFQAIRNIGLDLRDSQHIVIQNNIFEDTFNYLGAPVWIERSEDVVFQSNKVVGSGLHASQVSELTLQGNAVFQKESGAVFGGIEIFESVRPRIINNLVAESEVIGLFLLNSPGALIFNNTIHDSNSVGLVLDYFSHGAMVINNLFSKISGEAIAVSGQSHEGLQAHHNLFDQTGFIAFVNGVEYADLANWQTTAWGTGSVAGAAAFLEPLATPLEPVHLQLTGLSAALDAGADLSAEFGDDYWGFARGAFWDIGFHEYTGTIPTPSATITPTDTLTVTVTPTFCAAPSTVASLVLGQPDLLSIQANRGLPVGALGLDQPEGLASDGQRFAVTDTLNHRVLIYNSLPTSLDVPADIVLGQTDMNSHLANRGLTPTAGSLNEPRGALFADGKLLISDAENHRVLIYDLPLSTDQAASVVIGQIDFDSGEKKGASASTLGWPSGLAWDGQHLYVTDLQYHRVLVFDGIPQTNGVAAAFVVGQAGFENEEPNAGGINTPSQNSLEFPMGIAVDGSYLWVADMANHRVLAFALPITTNGPLASLVLGQEDFVSNQPNRGGVANAATLNQPTGVTASGGRLYISDGSNNRIVIYEQPIFESGQVADSLLGQQTFEWSNINPCGALQAGFNNPIRVITVGGKVWVADFFNNRVLAFGEGPTLTATQTFSHSPSVTLTMTLTATATETVSPTGSPTFTPTVTETMTSTYTPTVTETSTFTLTWTSTSSATKTSTPTASPSSTVTVTASVTLSNTSTMTSTPPDTFTVTRTGTPTFTATSTHTPTATPTHTPSWTTTAVLTHTLTHTTTDTHTLTMTATFTPTPTFTLTVTGTTTLTLTPTVSETLTQTLSVTPTHTTTDTQTLTMTATFTPTPTFTLTVTGTTTLTLTPTVSETLTQTLSVTPTHTTTDTQTLTMTATFTPTPTFTLTVTGTTTLMLTPTVSETLTQTLSVTPTHTTTDTQTLTMTATFTPTPTFTLTVTGTKTLTLTPTVSETSALTLIPTLTKTMQASSSPTATWTLTKTASRTATFTPTPVSSVPCLAWGIIANTGQSIHNGGTLVDSYRSSLGAYGGANVFANGGVRAATQLVLNGNAQIMGPQIANSPAGLTPLPTPVVYNDLGDLNINGDYTFAAGDYLVSSLNINGNPTVKTQGGRVRIWFKALNLAGTVGLGGTLPDDLWFFSRTDAWHANINGTCKFTGVIFAPNIPINHNGTGGVFGALVGSTVTLNGNAKLHYDEDLGGCSQAESAPTPQVTATPKKGKEGHKEHWLAAADDLETPAWELPSGKDLLVAPNPAKDTAKAFFRLDESGTVRLRIVDVTGKILRDQNSGLLSRGVNAVGLQTEGLASGVYFLVVQVNAGQGWQSKATTKFAVLK